MRRTATFTSVLLPAALGMPLASWPREAVAETAVFQQGVAGYSATVDTFLKGASPGTSYGSSSLVEWDGSDGGGQNFGLLRFDNIFGSDPGQIPTGVTIISAALTYNVVDTGDPASVNEVLVDWDGSVTYSTFGGDAGVQADEYGSYVGSASGEPGDQTLDVTGSLTAWGNDPSANKGWIFRPTGGSGGVGFRSSENGATSGRPKLTVTYVPASEVMIFPDHVHAVAGSADEVVSVFIPAGSNDTAAIQVTLTSDDASVAVPVGAIGDSLALTFPAGGPTQQAVSIDIGAVGSAAITTTNDAGLDNDTLTVNVGPGAVAFMPDSITAVVDAHMPVGVSISAGSNDTRCVQVTLTTDDADVAVPVGASGGSLVLTFAMGGPATQMVDMHFGQVGGASITTTNDGGLDDATLPIQVAAGFNFTVTADPRDQITRFSAILAAIQDHVGGPGVFHLSAGDIDPLQPLRDAIDAWFGPSMLWYPGIGNHEAETPEDMTWLRNEYHNGNEVRIALKNFTNQDGPAGTVETTYSWDCGNTRFIMLNEYWDGGTEPGSDVGTDGDIVPELYDWLAARLATDVKPVVFVFGHEPAFPFHRHVGNSLDQYPAHRDAFWALLQAEGVHAYFCGHTHVYKRYRTTPDGTWQIDAGNAGNSSSEAPDPHTFVNVTVTDTLVQYDVWRSSAVGSSTYGLEDTWTEPIRLKIGLSAAAINRRFRYGDDPPEDGFTVAAVGPGTLNYTITDDADWLSVSPTGGDSTGEADPIEVSYDTASLDLGTYNAAITVSDPNAANSPKTILVTLGVFDPGDLDFDVDIDTDDFVVFLAAFGCSAGEPQYNPDADYDGDDTITFADYQIWLGYYRDFVEGLPLLGDFDGDRDVDQADFGHLQACLTGQGTPQTDPDCSDADLDGDGDVDQNDVALFRACMSGPNLPVDPACRRY